MFVKDIKIRSNNQIKSSEKKNLLKEILKQYPTVNEDELKNLIRVKDSEISYSKIVTHDSIDLIVYFSDKIPYFFKTEKDDQLIPTVYFLWKFPNILPKFYTHREVFNRLANGADLMMPGIIVKETVNLYTFKHIKKNDLVSICLNGNEAPIAVGRTCLSGEDMYMSAMKGRCVSILNIYEDNLWAMGDKSIQIPLILPQSDDKQVEKSNETDLSEVKNETQTENINDQLEVESKELEEKLNIVDEVDEANNTSEVDHSKLLEECFLCSIKFRTKEFKLPIIISTFNKIMQTCSPVQFDLKQTPYKKISVFLKEMEKKGLIRTKELQKGVLSITEISKDNETLKYFKKPDWFKEEMEAKKSTEETKISYSVVELYKIDGNTDEFFRPNFKRGDILQSGEIRQFTMNYIKQKSLQSVDKPKYVKLDDLLIKIFFKNKQSDPFVTFDELFAVIFSKLSPTHQIKRDDNQEVVTLKKGKFQPVEFKLESRGGNKKVTCVYNLAPFELDQQLLQNKIKKVIGCSVTINEPSMATPNSNDYVVCVQGNQIFQVSELLKNEFGIQIKYMSGLEQGVKP